MTKPPTLPQKPQLLLSLLAELGYGPPKENLTPRVEVCKHAKKSAAIEAAATAVAASRAIMWQRQQSNISQLIKGQHPGKMPLPLL